FAGQRVVEADGFQRVDEYREVVAFRRDLVEAFRSPGSGGLVVERRGRTRFGLRRLVQRLVGGRGLAGLGDARLFAGLGAGRNPGARGLGDPRLDLRGAIQVLRGPEARAGDVDLRHQAAPCYAKGANAAEERLLGGDAA